MHSWVSSSLAQFGDAVVGVAPWLVAAGGLGLAFWALRTKSRANEPASGPTIPPDFDSPSGERVLHDISLRTLADSSAGSMVDSALLIESERRYQQLFQLSPEALAVMNATNGVVLAANEAFGRLLRGAHSDFEGFPLTNFVAEVHGFRSIGRVFVGLVLGAFAMAFGLVIVFGVIGALLAGG